ncbi:hypothetical protein HRbin11_00237 [bacterium HR11]|nr:hypothetical protein HRbin11_00237 [bacterium HR11]
MTGHLWTTGSVVRPSGVDPVNRMGVVSQLVLSLLCLSLLLISPWG